MTLIKKIIFSAPRSGKAAGDSAVLFKHDSTCYTQRHKRSFSSRKQSGETARKREDKGHRLCKKVGLQMWRSLQTELRRVHTNTHTAGECQRSCTVRVTYQAQHVSPLDMEKKQTVT